MRTQTIQAGALAVMASLLLVSLNPITADASNDDPIVIGAVVAKTGFMQQYDIPSWTTATLAIEDINEGKLEILDSGPGLLGRKVEYIVRDYRTDRALGSSLGQEVIDAGADFLIVSCDFDYGSPAAIPAEEAGIVSISLCAGSPRFGPEGGLMYGFSAGSVAESSAAAAAEWGFEEKGWSSVYLLNDPGLQVNTDWSHGFEARFTELAGADAVIGRNTFQNDDANINSQINAIRGLDEAPEVIVLTSYPPGGARAVRQVRSAGIEIPILVNDAMDGSAWWDTIPESYRHDIYVATNGHYHGDDERAEVNELTERYREATGEYPPSSLFLDGYGAIEMLAMAVEHAGTTDGDAVVQALRDISPIPRIGGPATFTETLHIAPDRTLAILELDGSDVHLAALRTPCRIPKYEEIVDRC